MKITLSKQLKKRAHIKLAMLQDEVVDIMYSISSNSVFHGGTAIWRCYNGNRFSEDLDFYAQTTRGFEHRLRILLEQRGLKLLKYKKAPYVVFAKISNDVVTVKLELTDKKIQNTVLMRYEKTDGTYIDIYTLSAEDLIQEKIGAYLDRRFIRDIYDIYHLSSHIENKIPKIADFLATLPNPVDEKNLRTLLYSGASPSFDEIIRTLKRRFG